MKHYVTGLPDQGQHLQLAERVPNAMKGGSPLDDVFCMVKETMASQALSQDPLLVCPSSLMPNNQQVFRECNRATCPLQTCRLTSDRKEELRLIRQNMARDFPHLRRSLAWYDLMIGADLPASRVPRLSFLTVGRQHEDWGRMRLPQRSLGPKPHELQVRFHRNR